MSDVIEKMMSEYTLRASNHPSIHEQHRTGMTAAARVLLDEALGPVTDVDRRVADYPIQWNTEDINDMLDNRRARLLPKSKDAAERVRLRPDHETNECFDVLLDGKEVHTFCGEVHAERYVAGLIAELKRKADREGR